MPIGVAAGAASAATAGRRHGSTRNAACSSTASKAAPTMPANTLSLDEVLIATKGAWAVNMTPKTSSTSVPPT